MLHIILLLLIGSYLTGFLGLPWLEPFTDAVIFSINNQDITLRSLLMVILVLLAISVIPKTLRIVAGIALALYVLSLIGIVQIAGLQSLLIISLIIGLGLNVFGFVK